MASAVDPRLFDLRNRDDRPEITPQIFPWGVFLLLVGQNQHHLLSLASGFTPCHKGIKWVSSRIFCEPSGPIPCVASSAITWVNLPTVGGQPTRMYQLRQWACNRHSVHGKTSQRYSTDWKAAYYDLFQGFGVFYWTTVEWKELLPDSSLSHLDYGSTSYDLGLCGTSMSGICYIIAKQYWEAWGLFWKRSVSLCILGVLLGFGCFGRGWLVFCCLVFCVGWWHLGFCLTYSLIRGIGNRNKTYWWPSELQARTATAKKKGHFIWDLFWKSFGLRWMHADFTLDFH